MYDGDRTDVEYGISDIHPFIKRWSKLKIKDLPTYKDYYREFQKIVGWLHVKKKISDDDYKLWFWAGLPERFRKKVETQLRSENPKLDVTQPFELASITDAVKKLYTRDRFENRIPMLIKGYKRSKKQVESEVSESEEESEVESSSEESAEEVPTVAERIKEMTKTRKAYSLSRRMKETDRTIKDHLKKTPTLESRN